jgi:hypothetical protein
MNVNQRPCGRRSLLAAAACVLLACNAAPAHAQDRSAAAIEPGIERPDGLVVASDGAIWMASHGDPYGAPWQHSWAPSAVARVTPDGRVSTTPLDRGSGFPSVSGLTPLPDGSVALVAGRYSKRFEPLAPALVRLRAGAPARVRRLPSATKRAGAIAIARDGTVCGACGRCASETPPPERYGRAARWCSATVRCGSSARASRRAGTSRSEPGSACPTS